MSNYGYCDFNNSCNGNLDSIIDDININDLADALENNTEAINSINPNNQFTYCDLFNILMCYGSQFINLIYLVLFLYWWSNQSIYCFLMNQNCQMTNGINDLLNQCYDNCCKK